MQTNIMLSHNMSLEVFSAQGGEEIKTKKYNDQEIDLSTVLIYSFYGSGPEYFTLFLCTNMFWND